MGFTNNDWDTRGDKDVSSVDDGAEGGGDGVMDVWFQDRTTQLQRLAGGSFENFSEFDLPKGVTVGRWDTAQADAEKRQGIYAEGAFSDTDGSPLSGEARIETGGKVLDSAQGSGAIILASAPPSGVTSGDPGDVAEIDFKFEPTTDGVSYVQENIGRSATLGSVQYGDVAGTVTNVDGTPVGGVGVSGPGYQTTTADDGSYRLIAPNGANVSISAVGATENTAIVGGGSVTQDFQFSRLRVAVVTPSGDPVLGADVRFGSSRVQTDEKGIATLDLARLQSYTVEVGDVISDTVTISSQGSEIERSYGGGFAGVEVVATDTDDRSPAVDSPVVVEDDEVGTVSGRTDGQGVGRALVDTDGERRVRVALGDRRYVTNDFRRNLTTGSVESVDADLERDQTTGRY